MPVSNMLSLRFGFPDVCLTALGVPLPFPNFSLAITDICIALRILVGGCPASTLADQGTLSLGDQGGVAGVASGIIMGPARGLFGSVKLFFAAMPAKKLCSPHIQNNTNAPGLILLVAQFRMFSAT